VTSNMVNIDELVQKLETYNQAYRNGQPQVSDAVYDRLLERLREADPGHPYLSTVEPEQLLGRKEVRHPLPMLSTEKAYTPEQLQRYVNRVLKAAKEIGIGHPILFRVTPKLDGLAGRDDGEIFASRGNGIVGYEISSAFDKGVLPIGGRGQGLGEIVAVQSYFDTHLADKFEHPRNMVVGIVSSDTLNPDAGRALREGKVHFVPYAQLPFWQGDGERLLADVDAVSDRLMAQTDYPLDGVVVDVVDERIKTHMGATAHHYRWQIAVKRKGETTETTVEQIHWQVGRTGNVTPVLEVAPVVLSGATIRRVTAHNAGLVSSRRIGPGARIEIIRSGEVIPKLEQVLVEASRAELPETCPVCDQSLSWRGDFLRCTNRQCPAKMEQRISHWFKTLANADWFGIKTIQKIVAAGFDSLEKIYAMIEEDFLALGFGPVQSKNLAEALATSRRKEIEDWRFLAAFGIPDLGVGDSRRLLQHIPLEALIGTSSEAIAQIDGFGAVTGSSIARGIGRQAETIAHMLGLGFNLERTALLLEQETIESPISGKKIVFSGKMESGSREEMQARARDLGALVQTAVSGATDMLVCGSRVGGAKLEKANRLGVKIVAEEAYRKMIGESVS
jgi:DNA ligase (NAD+)